MQKNDNSKCNVIIKLPLVQDVKFDEILGKSKATIQDIS